MPRAKTKEAELLRIEKIRKIAKEKGFGKWMKGKKLSEETKEKMRKIMLGNTINNGRKHGKYSKERCENISKALKGKNGHKQTEKTRLKISATMKKSKEKCYNWKGGNSRSEEKKVRSGVEYRLWREAIFKRDNHTCQKCNLKGVYLHPHHIKNFSKYIELRFDIDNGITLCKKCHNKFHKIYGKINNTLEQLKEFLCQKD